MNKTRNNHYVPQWYQHGFFAQRNNQLRYLHLEPTIYTWSGGEKVNYIKKWNPSSQCFYHEDLYTTFWGDHINDDIEKKLFGHIDNIGSHAIRAFIDEDFVGQHDHFTNFFIYLDSQKLRTPKGLDWIQHHYPKLNQHELMEEMQAIQHMHCTLWSEGVREIVSAKDSEVKFIISDHPVTVYNYACPPDSEHCQYPNDPSIAFKATQTIYPLNMEYALILTNLEYAEAPSDTDPLEQRTHAQKMRPSLVRTDAIIRSRFLNSEEVTKINYVIKNRAKSFIAAGKDEWLYPEKHMQCSWADIKDVLLPPKNQLFQFGGEIIVGYEDGSTHYQDAFGRITPENEYLKKDLDEHKIGNNDLCGCGSGKKYEKCCKNVPIEQRTTWKARSIRERNVILYNAIYGILGLDNGKTWDEVRHELCEDQIKEIYSIYASLWPIETNIYALLPKLDGKLRSLYTGFIDPRTIKIALSLTPYFDEMLVQHPFINPNNVKPEFSPIHSPNKFKYQFLKDVLFLITIEPFVTSGIINLIPDPNNFDYSLHRQMLNMAQQRREVSVLSKRDQKLSSFLSQQDLLNTIAGLPQYVLDQQIKTLMPDISNDDLAHIKMFIQENPLALIQKTDLENYGQLLSIQMTPNYEMALFIAQVTGAIIVTDSESRWNEFQKAQYREKSLIVYPWDQLSATVSEIILYADELDDIYSNAEFIAMRKTLKNINDIIGQGIVDSDIVEKLKREMTNHLDKIKHLSHGKEVFSGKIHSLIPKGGFVDKNVQRLLLQSNCEKYLNSTKIIIFIELTENDTYQ